MWHDVYMIKIWSYDCLRIRNTSESDPHSYEVTFKGSYINKAQKKLWGSNRIRTHDLRNTGVMLYQLHYEVSLEAGQVQVQFISIIKILWNVYSIL